MSGKKRGNKNLIGLHPTQRRPGESSEQRVKRVADEFIHALLELQKKQGNLRQPRPGEQRN
jgi:hypothetical protein